MSERNQYKIIFIDDEVSTLTYLQYALDWEQLRIRVCGTANEGRKGLALIREVNPDIVITDIRMPKYSGLDILEEIRKENRKCRVIMLSAYAEFEYARDALKLNATDYLLKPVDEKKLEERINNIVKDLDRENEHEGSRLIQEQERVLKQLLFTEEALSEADKKAFHEMNTHNSFLSCVIMDDSYISNIDVAYEHVKNILKKAMPDAVLILTGNREIRGIISWETYRNNELKIKFELNKVGIKIISGIAMLRKEEIRRCSWEAYLARSQCFYSGKTVEWYEKDMVFAENLLSDSGDYQDDVEKYCIQKNWAAMEMLAVAILQKEYARRLLPRQLASLAFDFFVCVKMYITKLYPEKTANVLRHLTPDYFEGAAQKEIFEKRITAVLRSIVEKMAMETEEQQESAIIRKAMEYTFSHYGEKDLSLQDVADYVGVSRNYFSTLFKEYKGKKYWDYLSEYRIEKAKKLLKETRKTNFEIALEIGYKSEYHFSRKFKLLTGMSPREYRNRKSE